ncbi:MULTISPECIES: hypothetical protein [Rhodobacterales]|jgi:hypothetical protein|uniref:Uncharacterized protein n=1 Tax=Phaeobacter gallaeciensis TaxID=60890 RepID=A0ABD4XAZ4_9RHOB|nr:hypothetical protein [Phaeobacter gallaeciensis]MDF1771719.1 hypothetical protein [Pseudophaeobacter sp. bin_em_oilr2.035]MEC9310941.1 hypothetical protein [Pseudomonadota bacterium]MDE4097800.1 hypothetical protein [Phaeobacter gallaeciensis]MDE4106362.1 hypothetical protein [Phaeobacter gallaeciensis]MDE4111064.1 hypothetical protein [Phaeobacter gallaeciensis]
MSTLICGTCGAPLSAQKARPLAPGKGAKTPATAVPASRSKISHQPAPVKPAYKPKKSKPRKKRKSMFQKVLSEAFDVIEDIFD